MTPGCAGAGGGGQCWFTGGARPPTARRAEPQAKPRATALARTTGVAPLETTFNEAQRRTMMDDQLKVWTTVGSAGTLNQADLAKVTLHQSIIQLGTELVPPLPNQPAAGSAAFDLGANIPTIQAVVRYNVTPVEGLFFVTTNFRYHLQLRFRGQVAARLMEVDLENGTETQRLLLDSHNAPPPNFVVQAVFEDHDSQPLDFVNKAYYVEATLVAPSLIIGHPAAISMIKIFASPNFPG
jgi:hypothetical protein